MNEIKHNYLYLIWKDPYSRRNYIVGKLTRNEKNYEFEYYGEYKNALTKGWKLMNAFPEEKVYTSDRLFAAFAGRLPDPKRKGINDILKKYGLSEYDGYELLKNSTGRLPIDTYEFIDPIFPEDEEIVRDFYIMGIRHHGDCKGVDCDKIKSLFAGTELTLVQEPENEYDPYAVKVVTREGTMLGYIPRYYSMSVTQRLAKRMTYSCNVIEAKNDGNCENCIKVRLRMPRE